MIEMSSKHNVPCGYIQSPIVHLLLCTLRRRSIEKPFIYNEIIHLGYCSFKTCFGHVLHEQLNIRKSISSSTYRSVSLKIRPTFLTAGQ